MDLWRHGEPVCGGLLKEPQHQQDHGGKEVQSVKPLSMHQQIGRQLFFASRVVAKLDIVLALLFENRKNLCETSLRPT